MDFSEKNTDHDLAIVLMIEPGKLEWQSIILISSILAFCYDNYKIYAYCRTEKVPHLNNETTAFLKSHNIDLIKVHNTFPDAYPQGNKVIACAQPRSARWTLFLDTDTAIMRPVRFLDAARSNGLSCVPARKKTWSNNIDDWRRLFLENGMDLPSHRIKLGMDDVWLPYFNGGFVLFDGDSFGKRWLEVSTRIDNLADYPSFRPWLDQVALTITAYELGSALNILDMKWNDTPLYFSDQTIVMHYHKFEWAKRFGIAKALNPIIQEFTKFKNFGEVCIALS